MHCRKACIEMIAPISVWSRLSSFPSQVTYLPSSHVSEQNYYLPASVHLGDFSLPLMQSYFSVSQLGHFGSVIEKVEDGRKESSGSTFSLVAWVQGIFYIHQLLCCGLFYCEDE